jgi:pimeloyl-ACP methyl ester carboxylesterase
MHLPRSWKTGAATAALCTVLAASPAAGHAAWGAQAAGSSVHTDQVCFEVHNQGDPEPSRVYGLRYFVANPNAGTRTVILVHGNSITHAFWDAQPDFSAARNLAEAGYLVIAYDRLGYGKSPYPRPRGAGYTLTLSSQRAMLHEVVAQVKGGTYTFAPHGACSDQPGQPVGLGSQTVILVGHSGGGLMVSGYPGMYHDVAAVVQAGWSNQGFSPAAGPFIARTVGPQLAAGNDYANLFPTPEDCETGVLYRPGVVPSLAPKLCRATVPAPAGELAGITATIAETLLAIPRVGPGLPVLLAWEDHDFFFSDDRQAAETQYWITHCGCDVQSWTESATGHAFIAHLSMPTFTAEVVSWLTAKGLRARQ